MTYRKGPGISVNQLTKHSMNNKVYSVCPQPSSYGLGDQGFCLLGYFCVPTAETQKMLNTSSSAGEKMQHPGLEKRNLRVRVVCSRVQTHSIAYSLLAGIPT